MHSDPFLTTIDIDLGFRGVSSGGKLIGACHEIGSRKTTGVSFVCRVTLGLGTGIGSEAGSRISTRGFWLAVPPAGGGLVDRRTGRIACGPVEVWLEGAADFPGRRGFARLGPGAK